MDVSEDWLATVGDQWERQFIKDVQNYEALLYPDLKVGMFVSNTPAWEMEQVWTNLSFCKRSKCYSISTLARERILWLFFEIPE